MSKSEAAVSVGVLCIQGAFIEHVQMLSKQSKARQETCNITVVDVRKPTQLASLDGLIIPGGESTTLSVFLRKNNFEEALKSWIFDEKKPGVVWGTCAGLILLSDQVESQKQGGQVTIGGLQIKCTRNMYGRQISSFESPVKLHVPPLHRSDLSLDSTAVAKLDECHGVFIRAPGVAELNSPNVKVLATLSDEDNSIVAVQQKNLIATSFHPELTNDMRWHSYFVDQVIQQRCLEIPSVD